MMRTELEIERKYLIRMPDVAALAAMPGCVIWDVEQTYLDRGADGCSRRIRKIEVGGAVKHVFTRKRRVDEMSCEETEGEISAEAYAELAKQADPERRPVVKRRFRILYEGQLLEVDVYRFWSDRATLEIELKDEGQQVKLPEWLDVIREVTGEDAYKNLNLSLHVPMEPIDGGNA